VLEETAPWLLAQFKGYGFDGIYNRLERGHNTVMVLWRDDQFEPARKEPLSCWSRLRCTAAQHLYEERESMGVYLKKRALFMHLRHKSTGRDLLCCACHCSVPLMPPASPGAQQQPAPHYPLLEMQAVLMELQV
jgi:hypothetical protein